LRQFSGKVEVLGTDGTRHVRYCPCEFARALVETGAAVVAHANGRIRSVRLVESAQTHAVRIPGAPNGRATGGTQFTRRGHSDSLAVWWWEFHPRSFW
jgi:hypothetical protein